jgi:hypothetical protein
LTESSTTRIRTTTTTPVAFVQLIRICPPQDFLAGHRWRVYPLRAGLPGPRAAELAAHAYQPGDFPRPGDCPFDHNAKARRVGLLVDNGGLEPGELQGGQHVMHYGEGELERAAPVDDPGRVFGISRLVPARTLRGATPRLLTTAPTR